MTKAQQAARRRAQVRRAQARYRAKVLAAQPPRDDGQDTWPDAPPLTTQPPFIPPQPAAVKPPPPPPEPVIPKSEPPDPDPRPVFYPGPWDPYRPAFWDVIDPNPKPLRVTLDPRSVYAYGAEVEAEQAAQQRVEADQAAKAARKAADHSVRSWQAEEYGITDLGGDQWV